MQIVAFDYGEKKIGVAVGQTETNTSSPLQIIFNNNDQVNWNEISFAGIDIVGKYLTEINITSPTCAREILDQTQMNPIEEYFKGL